MYTSVILAGIKVHMKIATVGSTAASSDDRILERSTHLNAKNKQCSAMTRAQRYRQKTI